jgi:hypothetical protein
MGNPHSKIRRNIQISCPHCLQSIQMVIINRKPKFRKVNGVYTD